MTQTSFAALVAVARRSAGMTAAEFDHSLAFPDGDRGSAMAAFGEAAYRLATEGLPVVTPGTGAEELDRRRALGRELIAEHRASIDAMVAEAKTKTYDGWSTASRGPIRYA